jgi:hypothetical protein
MGSTLSSNESNNSKSRRRISVLDVWMIIAPLALMAGYLSIHARISNYAFVARWLLHLFTAPLK